MKMTHFLAAVAACALVGCVPPPPPGETPSRFGQMQQAVDAYYARRDECKSLHGYNPDNPGDLGPHELAPTERAWAQCAYDAVRTTLMLETTQPRLYEAAMAEHRTMTDKVAAGVMTRAEREDRMFELRKEIREREIARVSADSQLDQIPQGVMDLIRNSSLGATRF